MAHLYYSKCTNFVYMKRILYIAILTLIASCTKDMTTSPRHDHQDRAALVAIYEALGGNEWKDNTNWCTDTPIKDWYGVSLCNDRVCRLDLFNNNLVGELPLALVELDGLLWVNFGLNKISGSIPAEYAQMKQLRVLGLYNNLLSGEIPPQLTEIEGWRYTWGYTVYANRFNRYNLYDCGIKVPEWSVNGLDGEQIEVGAELCAKSRYTVMFQWNTDESNASFLTSMIRLYERYKERGLEVIGWSADEAAMRGAIESQGISWRNFCASEQNPISKHNYLYYPLGIYPTVTVFDSEGKLFFSDCVESRTSLPAKLEKEFEQEASLYTTTDYSKDGEVIILQRATQGEGIDVVLLGDAFSDRLIEDGTYGKVMERAMEHLFAVEPYRSFRHLFNIYSVKVVSKHEIYGSGRDTALGCYFGEGAFVGGKDNVCFDYAARAVESSRLDEVLVIVMMNSYDYAGTCWMYYPEVGDYGSGAAVAYFPLGDDEEMFAAVLCHEAGGHGFAKLDDEYYYEDLEYMPAYELADRESVESFGWYKNTDVESDPAKVKWSIFLSDERYATEGLGVFEGASTYRYGIYRPSDDSIMNGNTGNFNAPSRQAIYYRIHRLAFGQEWEYDHEAFVAYDQTNRTADTALATLGTEIRRRYPPLSRPQVVRK